MRDRRKKDELENSRSLLHRAGYIYTSSLVEKIAYFKPFQIFMSCNVDSLFNANTWLYSFHCCFYCFIMFLKLLSFLFQEFIIHSNKEN